MIAFNVVIAVVLLLVLVVVARIAKIPVGSIAVSPEIARFFDTRRGVVDAGNTDFTNVSAVVLSTLDLNNGVGSRLRATGFGLPVFVVAGPELDIDLDVHGLAGVLASDDQNAEFFGQMVETAASRYDSEVLPPFFGALARYERRGFSAFDCPGHQGGQFFMRHPAGRRLVEFFGHNLFRADLCNADVGMGDLLIHEGAPYDAEAHAARVFNSDETYFVLNGTSASNKVVLGALLTPGDVVLFDRNNHKSVHHGALASGWRDTGGPLGVWCRSTFGGSRRCLVARAWWLTLAGGVWRRCAEVGRFALGLLCGRGVVFGWAA